MGWTLPCTPICLHGVHGESSLPQVHQLFIGSTCATVVLTCPYVHTHFAVGWVLAVALKPCVLMQQGKWLHPSSSSLPPHPHSVTEWGHSISCCRWHPASISWGNSSHSCHVSLCLHSHSIPTFTLIVFLYFLSGVILDKCCWSVFMLLHDVFSILRFRAECLFWCTVWQHRGWSSAVVVVKLAAERWMTRES